MSNKVEIFKEFLDGFETEDMRLYCEDMIERMPNYNFVIAASTTNKYHSPSQCTAGGQLKHVLQCCQTIAYILGLEYIQEKIPKKRQRDCMRVAMCLHDSFKLGLPTDHNQYTVFQHPLIAAEWIKTEVVPHDIKQGLKNYIARLVSVHSGQWVTNKRTSDVLPKPETDDEFIIHLCDYLSSRSNIEMTFSDEMQQKIKEISVPDPKDFFFSFGKYKDINFWLVYEMDKSYLYWLRDQTDFAVTQPLKTYLETLL